MLLREWPRFKTQESCFPSEEVVIIFFRSRAERERRSHTATSHSARITHGPFRPGGSRGAYNNFSDSCPCVFIDDERKRALKPKLGFNLKLELDL